MAVDPIADVQVTDDGLIQVTVDGITGPALSLATLQAMSMKAPEAMNRIRTHAFGSAFRSLADALLTAGPTMDATVVIQPGTVAATVDPTTFAVMQTALGVAPDPATGVLKSGPLTVQSSDTAVPAPSPLT